jgi:hypothetical protein
MREMSVSSKSTGKIHHRDTENTETDLLHSKAAKATKDRKPTADGRRFVLGFDVATDRWKSSP